MKNYTCGICGKEHFSLEGYLHCVFTCGTEEKAKMEREEKQKRMEEVNAALNKVKQAKAHYEEQLASFKAKYPEEYKMNFVDKDIKNNDWDEFLSKLEGASTKVSYEDRGDGNPIIKVNGEKITNKNLANDPEMRWIVEMLGLV